LFVLLQSDAYIFTHIDQSNTLFELDVIFDVRMNGQLLVIEQRARSPLGRQVRGTQIDRREELIAHIRHYLHFLEQYFSQQSV